MIPYASNTGTRRNLAELKKHGWGLLLVAGSHDWKHRWGWDTWGVDNGAWGAHRRGEEWDPAAFERCLERHGDGAQFIVAPDIVAGGLESLRLSLSWLPRLDGVGHRRLLAVQDGMLPDDVRPHLDQSVGIFVGGSSEWKEATMPVWGRLARATGCYLHVARVNTIRRIRLCQDCGADSLDGTSATRWSKNVPLLTAAVRQRHLWETP